MKLAKLVVIALAIMATTASAQPGAEPPVDAQADAGSSFDFDSLLARAEAASPTIETIARGAFRRARRAVAFGPTVGFWGGTVLAQEAGEGAITFGLALEMFKVPVLPTPESLKQLVIERAKAKVKEQVAARFHGEPADPVVLEQFIRAVWEEAVQEVLGLENVRPKVMERPAMNIALEVNRQLNIDAWTTRVRLGIGVWKLTLGGSVAVALGTDAAKVPVYTGVELVTHYLMSKNPRSSVLDVFVRADFELRNRDMNGDQLVLGVRYLLDAI